MNKKPSRELKKVTKEVKNKNKQINKTRRFKKNKTKTRRIYV